MSEKVTVEGNAEKLEYFDWHLEKLGLSKESETTYSGDFDSGEEISKVVNFCIRNEFEYSLGRNPAAGRYNYRTEFFKHNPPNAKGKYRCVYCGKWFDEDRIVVDHIYPASRVASDPSLQKRMKKMGIDNVNSLENLVPACEACAEKKGNRIGNWPKKAKRGLKDSYWIWKPIMKLSPILIFGLILFIIYLNPLGIQKYEVQGVMRDIFRWMMGL